MNNRSSLQSGFTLIEMIVALAVFSVVVTIAVGALLVLIATNGRLQDEQSVMTNLSFALDSMTREIRTGTRYYCANRPNYVSGSDDQIFDSGDSQEALGNSVKDCPNGAPGGERGLRGISFVEGGDSVSGSDNRILYFYDNVTGSPTEGKILRRVGDNPAQSIISSGIVITDAEFYVTGSESVRNDSSEIDQPTVTITMTAQIADDPTKKEYNIQTTVVQRTLDI